MGIAAGCAVAVAYLPGSDRAFGYDESVTIANFVRTPSLFDPFHRQVVYNNHVAFSFLEHLIYTITGSASERTMRFLPILCGAACVALVVAVLAARTTTWVALTAGALLATNPLFVDVTHEARGYSLLCLCGVASTVTLLSLQRSDSFWRELIYVGLLALGLATHLYMVFVISGQIVFVIARREMNTRWMIRWLAAAIIGGSAYVEVVSTMRSANRGSVFQPAFPRDLVGELLGHAAPTLIITGVGVGLTLWSLRRQRETRALALFFVAVVLGLWLGLAPRDLYPRFFVWVVPAVVLAAAAGLYRLGARRVTTAAVAVACLFSFAVSVDGYASDEVANRAAAGRVAAARSRGERVCGLRESTEALAPYAQHVRFVYAKTDFARCDLLVALEPAQDAQLLRSALAFYRHHRSLDARAPGLLLWN